MKEGTKNVVLKKELFKKVLTAWIFIGSWKSKQVINPPLTHKYHKVKFICDTYTILELSGRLNSFNYMARLAVITLRAMHKSYSNVTRELSCHILKIYTVQSALEPYIYIVTNSLFLL